MRKRVKPRPLPEGSKEKLYAVLKATRTKRQYQRVLCLWVWAALDMTSYQIAAALAMSAVGLRVPNAVEPDPDPSPGGFLYGLDEVRKTKGGGKGQSKPKSPLESAAAKNEPINPLMAQYLSNLGDQAEENKALRHGIV